MTSHDEIAKEFWNREVVERTHVSWMGDPLVRTYINLSLSGSPHGWPLNWFTEWLQGRTFRRALSVGCGSGGLERDLLNRGICEEMDAFDGSPESLRIAQEEARHAGMADRIHYSLGNFNEPQLPANTYDAVFAHHSMHHVAKLEKLYRALLRSMKPDALFYMDEYVGPSRHQWTDENFAAHRALYESLPQSARNVGLLPMPIQPFDPSEAIRSAEIVPELRVGFDILEKRNYGGNVLSVMYTFTDGSVTERLIEAEKEMLAKGAEPYHAVIVARPKRGAAKHLANARYFLVPKVKRVLRALGILRL